jgi:nucleoside-diphosphate-sugar epimerase
MKKAFITGAAGFLAGHLIDVLSDQNYEITGLIKPHHNADKIEMKGVKVIRGFLDDPLSYRNFIPANAVVIHCYALSSGAKASEEVYMKENSEATRIFLETCKERKISKLVHISSTSVIGPKANRTITEDLQANPLNYYGQSKLKAEGHVKNFYTKTKTPTIILRLSTIYGPRAHKNAAFYRLFKMVSKFPVQFVLDGGNHIYEFNYIKNITYNLGNIIKKDFKFGIYNLGDINKSSYKKIIQIMSKEMNPRAKLVYLPSQLLLPFAFLGDIIFKVTKKRFKFDTRTLETLKGSWKTSYDKAIDELNIEQKYDLEEGIKETVAYMKKENMI